MGFSSETIFIILGTDYFLIWMTANAREKFSLEKFMSAI